MVFMLNERCYFTRMNFPQIVLVVGCTILLRVSRLLPASLINFWIPVIPSIFVF